jgi:hypothetical protein
MAPCPRRSRPMIFSTPRASPMPSASPIATLCSSSYGSTRTCHGRRSTSARGASSSGFVPRSSGGRPNRLRRAYASQARIPSLITPVPSRGSSASESPGPAGHLGARVAPITEVVPPTTGRDANKSSPDEVRGTPLGRRPRRPDDTNQADHRILDAGGPDHMVRRHVVTDQCDPAAPEGPSQRSSRRPRPRDWKRGEPIAS